MDAFQYYLPTKIVFGLDSINKLPEVIAKDFPKTEKILLVTGRSSLQKEGITDKILKLLEDFTVVLFDKVDPNPTSDVVNDGLEKYKEHECNLLISIGGGSVLDTGKAIAILNNNEGSLEDYQQGQEPVNEGEPHIAIPTTSGTSSEMTVWSVITNLEGAYKNVKKSFSSPKMYPHAAIIDPKLSVSLDAKQTASTGLDALCHSIEGAWSKKRNPLSTVYLLEAIKLIVKYLPKVVKNGHDLEAREKMSFAAMLAGLGFSNSRTTAPHKVSYPITTQYNLPHGAACAITLPYFMEYIGSKKPELLGEIVTALGCKDWQEAAEFLKNFVKEVGMPNKLSELGMEKEDLRWLAKKSYVEIEKQEDSVPMTYEEYVNILESAL